MRQFYWNEMAVSHKRNGWRFLLADDMFPLHAWLALGRVQSITGQSHASNVAAYSDGKSWTLSGFMGSLLDEYESPGFRKCSIWWQKSCSILYSIQTGNSAVTTAVAFVSNLRAVLTQIQARLLLAEWFFVLCPASFLVLKWFRIIR